MYLDWAILHYSFRRQKMIDKIKENWEKILLILKEEHEVSDVSYRTWLQPLTPYSFKGNTVTIIVPEQTFLAYVKKKYGLLLKVTISEFLDQDCDVDFKVKDQIEEEKQAQAPSLIQKNKAVVSPDVIQSANLNPKYTFDTFVVGDSNKLAYAAARAVADAPAEHYNPLFIYGDSGLGKTHLIYAIAHEIRTKTPNAKIVYIKGDDFTNELVEAIRTGKNVEFRSKYRDADLLLMDDVQFIAGRKQTQEEFFHTFNTLYESKRQIVLTSDRSPKEMQLLDDRLQTRFEWGLLVDVQPPDFETRLAIVKNKAAQWGSVIDDDIAKYIAENVSSNVRQLEGAMNKILAYRDLIGKEMDEESANRAVRDMLRKSNEYIPTAASIIDEVSRFFGIDEAVVKGPSRSREAVTARQAAMYLVRRMTNLSTPDIGREFGGRDHTTVLHALEQVETKLQNDPGFAQTIKDITININSKK